ncbi:MAG TPA: hypothetical protein VFY96_11005 [Candidatus Binatia bacterium]|nr:hypothetical protein [Candidatus Binatia bacterium]
MAEEVLLDVKTADAANLYKFFYLNQQKKILGSIAVILFLTLLWLSRVDMETKWKNSADVERLRFAAMR